jgi:hypothetical protein
MRAATAAPAGSGRLPAAECFAGPQVLRAAAAGPAGSGRLPAVGRFAGPQALRAAAAGPAGSGRLPAVGRFAGPRAVRAAAAAPAGSGRLPAVERFAGRPVPRAAQIAGWAAFERSWAVSHEAASRVGSAPVRVEAREALDRAAFALTQVAAHRGAAVGERAARWPAPVGREVGWRLAGVAGQAPLEAGRLAPAAGRVAACLYRPRATLGLARGEFRPLLTQKASMGGTPWRPELLC